jgi:hypothetical protein
MYEQLPVTPQFLQIFFTTTLLRFRGFSSSDAVSSAVLLSAIREGGEGEISTPSSDFKKADILIAFQACLLE